MRYVPEKRTAIDGRVWWVVWDCQDHNYSTCMRFGRYKTKKACQSDIDFNTKYHPEIMDIW